MKLRILSPYTVFYVAAIMLVGIMFLVLQSECAAVTYTQAACTVTRPSTPYADDYGYYPPSTLRKWAKQQRWWRECGQGIDADTLAAVWDETKPDVFSVYATDVALDACEDPASWAFIRCNFSPPNWFLRERRVATGGDDPLSPYVLHEFSCPPLDYGKWIQHRYWIFCPS